MSGQPIGFDVVSVCPTEPVTAQSPALIIQAGDSVTLKTYLHFKGQPFEKAALDTYLTALDAAGNPQVVAAYHLQDLETGAMVPGILGGKITAMSPAEVAAAVAAGCLPPGSVISSPQNEGYWVSADTSNITTGGPGSGATLSISAGHYAGTWRVLTHLHSTLPQRHFSAFDDGLLIEVIQ